MKSFFLLTLLATSAAFARPTFGPEFNFTNYAVQSGQGDGHHVSSAASEAARDQLAQKMGELCPECDVKPGENDYGVLVYQITYPDGFNFEVATDPGVVEVQMKASTEEEIIAHEKIIQEHLFDAAAAVGLQPATAVVGEHWAGSHLHVGASSSLGEGRTAVRLLKDFMVDFTNHRELAEGIFSNDMLNAPPIARLPEEEQKAFEEIAHAVDTGRIRSINTFAERIRNEVYDVALTTDYSPTTKYQAFNVNRIGNSKFAMKYQTWEIRAMRGPRSAHDFVLEVQLIQARLDYIKKHPGQKLAIPAKPLTTEEQVESFYHYVTDTGLPFDGCERFLRSSQLPYLAKVRMRNGEDAPTCQLLFSSAI